ncbi:cyclase family protein [Micromonospora sp. NPDC005324]|uniref:cyclase family protein n=1 Tax=Micromonospora sp. NPDC005324 TaxID=3157033 RepID=UPI0033BDF58E
MGEQWRAQFDAEVSFANGGRLRTEGFRLDIPGREITDDDLAALFVRHLGLLMVADVRISATTIIEEPHKGGRGVAVDGTEFQVARIDMIANTGTYLDTPAHRWSGRNDLTGVSLDRLADLPGVVVRVPTGIRAVDRLMLAPYEVAGRAVLLHTGWDTHFGTQRYGAPEAPYLTGDAAQALADAGATLVGIDSINIDDMSPTAAGVRPAHSTLLAAGIPIVEHLTGLDALPPSGFRFTAAPPMVAGMGTFPVRAFAVVDA